MDCAVDAYLNAGNGSRLRLGFRLMIKAGQLRFVHADHRVRWTCWSCNDVLAKEVDRARAAETRRGVIDIEFEVEACDLP